MNIYSTEEQQIEAIKRWWKQYNTFIIWTVLVCSVLIAGIRYWSHHRQIISESASSKYQTMQLGINEQDNSSIDHNGEDLVKNFTHTPYATLASYSLAKQSMNNQLTEEAKTHLEWIISHEDEPSLKSLAALRLAKILISLDRPSEAINYIAQACKNGYEPLAYELEGDLYLAQNNVDKAIKAYLKAWEVTPENLIKKRVILKMKLESLGQTKEIEKHI